MLPLARDVNLQNDVENTVVLGIGNIALFLQNYMISYL